MSVLYLYLYFYCYDREIDLFHFKKFFSIPLRPGFLYNIGVLTGRLDFWEKEEDRHGKISLSELQPRIRTRREAFDTEMSKMPEPLRSPDRGEAVEGKILGSQKFQCSGIEKVKDDLRKRPGRAVALPGLFRFCIKSEQSLKEARTP